MKILYADDTYAKATKDDSFPTIHLFGGVVISRQDEDTLIDVVRSVKGQYTHSNMPIKWNFKDPSIKKKYTEFKKQTDYERMLADSRAWRLEIFRRTEKIPYTIVVSCIEAFSKDKAVMAKVKGDLNTFCFENVLMRVGIDASEQGGHWQCVLDWPSDNDSRPFDRGYYQLFHFGKASSPKPSQSGPLKSIGFSHSLHFTRCNHSPMMQFTDLVLGATRDHIETHMQGRKSCVGSEAVQIFYNHYRNYKGSVPRYGVCTSTGSKKLSKCIAHIFCHKTNKVVALSGDPLRDTCQ